MVAEDAEDRPEQLQVLGPGGAVDEDVVEEHKDAPAEERLEHKIH
jgi:hypothetical protein